jgi:O-antigen/teichoic acid export membrane protein
VNDIELLVKRSAITAAANLSTAVAPIVLLPLLTKTLTIEDYGIWTLVVVTASLLPMIVMLGLPNALVRFLASSKNADEIREQYYSMALIILAADLFVSFLLLLLARPIATYLLDNNYTLALLLPAIFFFASYNYLPLAYFRTFQQARRFSRITFLQAILYVAFVGLFVALGFGVVGAALGFLVMQVLVSLISSYVVVSDIGISIPTISLALPSSFSFLNGAPPLHPTSRIL